MKKLFYNYILFQNETDNLLFISNQGVKAKLRDDSDAVNKESTWFSDFTDPDKEKIHESIEGSSAKHSDFYGLNLILIRKTDLPVDSHDTFTKGKLVDFFSNIKTGKAVAIDIAYKTLFDEVKRKNNTEMCCSNFDELKKAKGISYNEFNKIVSTFISYASNSESWNNASDTLSSEGFSFSTIRKIKSAWGEYTIEIMNTFDTDLNDIRSKILSEIQSYEKNIEILLLRN
ncbi:MAG: hypothetical protein ACTFAL_05525 [Candidatus Electronema sp. V4]|uniref:hypothetical protein n=1 Tax=Candidatus Electronema sp. V4 TaxID=3454756 RepID=UPI00405558F6